MYQPGSLVRDLPRLHLNVAPIENWQAARTTAVWIILLQAYIALGQIFQTAEVADEIKAIFVTLSDDDILPSCLHGDTQTQNKPFNALIWQHYTKETHKSLPTVQLVTALAIGQFNDGARPVCKLHLKLELNQAGVIRHLQKNWKSKNISQT